VAIWVAFSPFVRIFALTNNGFPICGYDSVNRALLLELLELPLSAYWRLAQEPCCINEIDVNEAGACVRSINETQHAEHDGQ
jgi:probable phosphoglycerate mutase